jgi:hypothetical protein
MSNDAARDVVEAESSPNQPFSNPALAPATAYGARQASAELYDACLRVVEVANQIEAKPAAMVAMGADLKLRLIQTRLCAQQALDSARRLS